MTTLVLHIGSPKTGSTAIQAASRPSRWFGPSDPWMLLPPNPFGRPEPAGCIAAMYQPPDQLPRVWSQRHDANPRRFARDVTAYRRLLQRRVRPRWRSAPAALFLSSEYLWALSPALIQQLRQEWTDLGISRFLVIAYVRSPSAMYRSALQQHARLSTNLRRFRPDRWTYRFRQRLEAWHQLFADQLFVRPFDRPQLHQGCVVADLRQTIHAALPDLPPIPFRPASTAINESVTAEELIAMQEWMQRTPAPSAEATLRRSRVLWKQWDRLSRLRVAQQASGTPVTLDPAVDQLIQRRHQDDLDWLASRFGVQLPAPKLGGATASARAGAEPWPDSLEAADVLDGQLQDPWLTMVRSSLSSCRLPRD